MVTPILPYNGRDEMPKISESLRKELTKKVEEKNRQIKCEFLPINQWGPASRWWSMSLQVS